MEDDAQEKVENNLEKEVQQEEGEIVEVTTKMFAPGESESEDVKTKKGENEAVT